MSELMPVHLALRSGGHACDASYPGLFSTSRREAVTCAACLDAASEPVLFDTGNFFVRLPRKREES